VYGLVERIAKKFASRRQRSSSFTTRGERCGHWIHELLRTMLITIGLLVELDEKEVELVVGHELSH